MNEVIVVFMEANLLPFLVNVRDVVAAAERIVVKNVDNVLLVLMGVTVDVDINIVLALLGVLSKVLGLSVLLGVAGDVNKVLLGVNVPVVAEVYVREVVVGANFAVVIGTLVMGTVVVKH